MQKQILSNSREMTLNYRRLITQKLWQYDEVDENRLLLHVEAGGRSVSFTSLFQMVCARDLQSFRPW